MDLGSYSMWMVIPPTPTQNPEQLRGGELSPAATRDTLLTTTAPRDDLSVPSRPDGGPSPPLRGRGGHPRSGTGLRTRPAISSPLFEMLHIYMVWLGFAKTHTYPVWGMTTLRQFRSPPAAPVPVLSHWSITAIENAQSGV